MTKAGRRSAVKLPAMRRDALRDTLGWGYVHTTFQRMERICREMCREVEKKGCCVIAAKKYPAFVRSYVDHRLAWESFMRRIEGT